MFFAGDENRLTRFNESTSTEYNITKKLVIVSTIHILLNLPRYFTEGFATQKIFVRPPKNHKKITKNLKKSQKKNQKITKNHKKSF